MTDILSVIVARSARHDIENGGFMRNGFSFYILSLLLVPASAISAEPPGASIASSIEVCEPIGEQAYIRQLTCPDGNAPEYKRTGNVGPRNELTEEFAKATLRNGINPYARLAPGATDHHWIDRYELTCKGQAPQYIHMDMYHCGVVNNPAPPAGFRMNINPDTIAKRNGNLRNALDADARSQIDQLLYCHSTMLYGSKLPGVSNAKAMRRMYPRLQIAAYMIGVTHDYDRAFSDAFRSNLPARPDTASVNDLVKKSETCLAQFSNRPDLYLFDWESEMMRRLYKD